MGPFSFFMCVRHGHADQANRSNVQRRRLSTHARGTRLGAQPLHGDQKGPWTRTGTPHNSQEWEKKSLRALWAKGPAPPGRPPEPKSCLEKKRKDKGKRLRPSAHQAHTHTHARAPTKQTENKKDRAGGKERFAREKREKKEWKREKKRKLFAGHHDNDDEAVASTG